MKLKKLEHDDFKNSYELCKFVNEHNIKKEDIVEIIYRQGSVFPLLLFYYE